MKFDKAFDDLQRALQLRSGEKDPDHPHNYRKLALLLMRLDKAPAGDRGVAFAGQICQSGNWKIWRHLAAYAEVLLESGRYDDAIKWQNQAITLAPKSRSDELRNRLIEFNRLAPFAL